VFNILLNRFICSIIGVECCGSATGKLMSVVLSKSVKKLDCRRNGGNHQSDVSANPVLSGKSNERHQKYQDNTPFLYMNQNINKMLYCEIKFTPSTLRIIFYNMGAIIRAHFERLTFVGSCVQNLVSVPRERQYRSMYGSREMYAFVINSLGSGIRLES
jgi:hypothetical protein